MMDHLEFALQNLPHLLFGFPDDRPGGLTLNLIYATLSISAAFLLSLPIGWGRVCGVRLIRWVCAAFIEVIRAVPLILLVFWIYCYGSTFGCDMSPFVCALIGLVLYGTSYLAETVGAGLRAVPKVQLDAARADGLSALQIATAIRLPQALRISLPDITSLFITIFKDSSVVMVIGAGELMYTAQVILNRSGANAEYLISLYLLIGVIFLIGAVGISRGLRRVEKWVFIPARAAGLTSSFYGEGT